jgi:biotin carboxyl carrier protein
MTPSLLLLCSLAFPAEPSPAVPPAPVSITLAAPRAFVEERTDSHLNFDFNIRAGADSLWLSKVEVSVYDQAGALVLRKFVDNNGFSPAISSLSHTVFAPGQAALLFNPFHTFTPDVELARLAYTFEFRNAKREPLTQTLDVRPERYQPKAALHLPLTGRQLIWDGHDEGAHHRRLDYLHPVAQQVGIKSNFMRYAHDFVLVNEAGATHSGDGKQNSDYPGFNQPVHAPAAGKVVAAYAGQKDNDNGEDYFNPAEMAQKDPLLLYGNYVVIDHGNGEFSLLGHLRQNSVLVKVGEQVKADQVLAHVGSSGSSYFPHLHYELRTGAEMNVEGLPAYFHQFRLLQPQPHRSPGCRRQRRLHRAGAEAVMKRVKS